MTARRTYLDYNASAPLRAEARAAMVAALDLVGNPSSVHAEGRRARATVEAARSAVAGLIGARAADVVFTSGATEANATVVGGGWDTIFLSALEHDSVRSPARKSKARVISVPVSSDGVFNVGAFADLVLTQNITALGRTLVCVQLANNETGVLQPVQAVAAFAKAHGISVHCDAVQAPGRIAVDCTDLGVDYLAVSAHKLGGPKGVGALVCVDGAPLPALIAGGGQERGRRSGTENIAAISGFGAAASAAGRDLRTFATVRVLRDRLEAEVAALTPAAHIMGVAANRIGNTSCLALAGLTAEALVIRLDLAGVAVSAGAACSSGKVGESAALAAMGLAPDVVRSAIRISLGMGTTAEDVDVFLAAWATVAAAQSLAA